MKYAVIRINKNQYQVKEGDEIVVDRLKDNKPVVEVLMVANEDKIFLGKPVVSKAKVDLKVVTPEQKGDKIHVYKFKAKSRYRRKLGFRPLQSVVKIGKISV
jgi:large subunit ribosomal protein L21